MCPVHGSGSGWSFLRTGLGLLTGQSFQVPIACWCLVPLLLQKLATASPTGSMTTEHMVRHHPDAVREALEIFHLGERALALRSTWDRPDGSDFAERHAEAKQIVDEVWANKQQLPGGFLPDEGMPMPATGEAEAGG